MLRHLVVAIAGEAQPSVAAIATQSPEERQRYACHFRKIHRGGGATQARASPKHSNQGSVEANALDVPGIPERFDPWQRLHAPVEAQLLWPQEQSEVGHRQVQKGQKPSPNAGFMSRRIVCG